MSESALTGWVDDGRSVFYRMIAWNEAGQIVRSEPLPPRAPFDPERDAVISAGLFNAHSHPEQSVYTDIVDPAWDLGTWCRNTIYKYSVAMNARRVRLACRRAFARMMMYGTTSVMVSYYLHGNRGNELDREVIAAARDVGIRLIFGRMNYDIINDNAYEGKKASQRSYYETIPEAEKNLRELMSEEDAAVMICPALHSFHASTAACIEHGIKLGWELKRPVQLHLSEDQGDVELSLNEHGCRPVVYLQRLLDEGRVPSLEHVILSDCCWLDDEERAIIAKNKMRVVFDARMNARVKTGFPDVAALVAAGVPMWCGTDGEASNDDLNVENEKAFIKKQCPSVDPQIIDGFGRQPFDFRGANIGVLAPGAWADLRVIRGGKVESVYVGGTQTVKDGRLLGLDIETDIEAPLRAEVAAMTAGN